jgi:hypothetical protein
MCALALFAGPAQAGSRFETSAAPGAKAATHLDFTIVIPEVVYLGSAKAGAGKDAPAQLTMQATDRSKPDQPFQALTNGGTLAFAQTGVAPLQPSEIDSKSGLSEVQPIRVYVVAMP